jgi:hypothetical protein
MGKKHLIINYTNDGTHLSALGSINGGTGDPIDLHSRLPSQLTIVRQMACPAEPFAWEKAENIVQFDIDKTPGQELWRRWNSRLVEYEYEWRKM